MDHREPQDPATDDPFLAFTSAAYVAEAEPELEASTAAWLEEQAAHPLIQAVAERSFAFMALEPGDAVLDVGCGVGVLLPALAAAVGPGGRVVGLDHSVGLLRRAQRRIDEAGLGSEVRLAHGDALRLPFPDATFDVAHMERVLMHLDEPDAAIRELRRVTRPGGRVLCAEVFPNGVEYDASDREVLFHVGAALLARFRRPSIGIELRRRLIGAGLEDVRVAGVVDVETQLDQDELDELRARGLELVDRGTIDRTRLDAVLEELARRDQEGTHAGMAVIIVALGRVPGPA